MTAEKRDEIPAQPPAVTGVLLAPTPRARSRLTTIREIRREMAKVYLEARNGELRTDSATRFVYMLTQLSNLIRDSELEGRVQQLEQEIARR